MVNIGNVFSRCMMRKLFLSFLLFISPCFYVSLSAQEKLFDLADKVVDLFSGEISLKRNPQPIQWVVAPVVVYAPETSWQFGLGGKVLFKPRRAGEDSRSGETQSGETRTSVVAFAVRFTLNKQFFSSPDYTIFSYKEKFIHRGEIAYIRFPRFFYGIGNDTPIENEELFSSTLLSVEHLTYRNIISKLYAGVGFRFASNFDIQTIKDGLVDREGLVGTINNRVIGWNFGLMYDNRDNAVAATAGFLAEFRQRFYRRYLGSDYDYTVGLMDFRHYIKPFQQRKDVVATQLYGYFSFGDTPFTELAALGGDMIMRGYYKGRYLDNLLLAAQTEYRMRVWRNLGMVGFVAFGDVAEKFRNFRLPDLKPSAGIGLRYALIPEENLNIRLDFAVGKATNNFYINISEAF